MKLIYKQGKLHTLYLCHHGIRKSMTCRKLQDGDLFCKEGYVCLGELYFLNNMIFFRKKLKFVFINEDTIFYQHDFVIKLLLKINIRKKFRRILSLHIFMHCSHFLSKNFSICVSLDFSVIYQTTILNKSNSFFKSYFYIKDSKYIFCRWTRQFH